MKAFKVFWHESISGKGEPYRGTAMIVAEDFKAAHDIAATYGSVKAINAEDKENIITEPKKAEVV